MLVAARVLIIMLSFGTQNWGHEGDTEKLAWNSVVDPTSLETTEICVPQLGLEMCTLHLLSPVSPLPNPGIVTAKGQTCLDDKIHFLSLLISRFSR